VNFLGVHAINTKPKANTKNRLKNVLSLLFIISFLLII